MTQWCLQGAPDEVSSFRGSGEVKLVRDGSKAGLVDRNQHLSTTCEIANSRAFQDLIHDQNYFIA